MAWIESFLPIKKRGIGIRHASYIALPCFLSLVYNVSALLNQLLPETYRQDDLAKNQAEEHWRQKFGDLTEESLRPFQNSWEGFGIAEKSTSIQNSLIETADKARFLVNSSEETGVWLQALPSPQIGTQ